MSEENLRNSNQLINSFDGSSSKKPDVNDITGAMKNLMEKLSSQNRSSVNDMSQLNSGKSMLPPELSVDEEQKIKKIDSEIINVPTPEVKAQENGDGPSKSALIKRRQDSSSVSQSAKGKNTRPKTKKNKTSSSSSSSSSDSSSSDSSDDDSISVSQPSAY